jgi:hypothetical protein
MAPIVILGVLAAIAVKGGSFIWGASISTSPLSEERRRHLLDHAEIILKKLEEADRLPRHRATSVREDVALLRENVAKGWTNPHEFRAATRVFNFMGWEHTKGALAGVRELLRNSGTIDTLYNDFFGKKAQRRPQGEVRPLLERDGSPHHQEAGLTSSVRSVANPPAME